MNRNWGMPGLIALLALFFHVASPSGPENAGGEKPPPGREKGQTDRPVRDDSLSEGPWLATQPFFQYHVQQKSSREISQLFGIDSKRNVEFLLAMVPDPVHTHLALFTDSYIEEIEKAANAAGWEFARQWLPWTETVNPEEKDPAKRQEQRRIISDRQKQPGSLVFRQKVKVDPKTNLWSFDDRVLIVFLVGETPTAGINPEQFQIARAYTRGLQAKDDVQILGPSFSGSFDSLARLINEDKQVSPGAEYTVRSGTATGVHAAEAFKTKTGVEIFLASANSDIQSANFMSVLDDLGIQLKDAALLVEDESSYGNAASRFATNPIRVFRFPRNISQLRNAYRETIQSSQNNKAPAPDLDFSLKDKELGEDSVPIFSATHSPLIQNAILNEITNTLRRDRVRIVSLTATNSLDLLFLARLLKRQCPDVGVLLTFPELLFIDTAQTESLTGTMALSTYPIFPASNQWMGVRQATSPNIHSAANSEGTFNAALLLLTKSWKAEEKGRWFDDYHWNLLQHPPTWLLTLDHEGYLPVRTFDNAEQANRFEDVPSQIDPLLNLPSPPMIWTVVFSSFSLLFIALAGWGLYLGFNPSFLTDARFAFKPYNLGDAWRVLYLFAFFMVLVGLQLVMVLPRFVKYLNIETAGCFLPWTTAFFDRSIDHRGFFFAFRAIELRVGSSPTWPILAAGSALLLFCFVHLTRLYLAVYQIPDITTEVDYASLHARLVKSHGDFSKSLTSFVGLSTLTQRISFLIAIIIFAILYLLYHVGVHLRSIDSWAYDFLANGLRLSVIVALLLTCWHITDLWYSMQSFLACLGTLPLANSFIRSGGPGGNQPIWVRHLNVQSLETHNHAIITLHDMDLLHMALQETDLSTPLAGIWYEAYRFNAQLLANCLLKTRMDSLNQHRSLRLCSKVIATELLRDLLRRYWISNALSEKVIYGPVLKEREVESKEKPANSSSSKSLGELAETFVCLHYSSFLIYGIRQIRNLALFLSAGFVLLIFSFNSYSVQSPQLVERFLLILFIVIAVVLWKCMAGMERDLILSQIAGTTGGKLNTEFYFKVLGYVALPAFGLLATEFPSISAFLFSWIQPAMEAMHK